MGRNGVVYNIVSFKMAFSLINICGHRGAYCYRFPFTTYRYSHCFEVATTIE